MATSIIGRYEDNLRNSLVHENSGSKIISDAPTDNQGKGESFSPTDLVAAALGSCMLTIIGIRANSKKIIIGRPSYSIQKHMGSNPRKISKIIIDINFKKDLKQEDRDYLEQEGRNCPVALSLNTDLIQEITFNYS